MALQLESIQAVEMDGVAYTPTVTTEAMLKLRNAKLQTEVQREEAIEAMAECFPGHAVEVKNFLKKCAMPALARLQCYLLMGDDGVKIVERRLEQSATVDAAEIEQTLKAEEQG